MTELTNEQLKLIINYNPDTGIFTWKFSVKRMRDKIAGTKTKKGYIAIHVRKRRYYAHRLAWFYMTGEWPKEIIDHENNIQDDNRWVNLREATNAQNLRNRGKSKNNTTGYKGIHKNRNGYMVRICIGTYKSLEEAAVIYKKAIKVYHGEFARVE